MPSDLDLTPLQYERCLLYFGHLKRVEDIAADEGVSQQAVSDTIVRARRKYPSLERQYHRRDFDPFA